MEVIGGTECVHELPATLLLVAGRGENGTRRLVKTPRSARSVCRACGSLHYCGGPFVLPPQVPGRLASLRWLRLPPSAPR